MKIVSRYGHTDTKHNYSTVPAGLRPYETVIKDQHMNENQSTRNRLLEGAVNYIFPLIMISLLPILVQPLADKWGYINYSSISDLMSGCILAVLWTLSLVLFLIFSRRMQKKGIFTVFEGTDELISTRSLLAASAILFCMILLISIRIDFKVKLFYDLGEKITGYDIFNRLGDFLKRAFRCAFIPLVCRGAYLLSNTIKNRYIRFALYIVLVLAYGIFEILYDHVAFPVIYGIFYISFAVLFLLMRKNYAKTMTLSLLIYLL